MDWRDFPELVQRRDMPPVAPKPLAPIGEHVPVLSAAKQSTREAEGDTDELFEPLDPSVIIERRYKPGDVNRWRLMRARG